MLSEHDRRRIRLARAIADRHFRLTGCDTRFGKLMEAAIRERYGQPVDDTPPDDGGENLPLPLPVAEPDTRGPPGKANRPPGGEHGQAAATEHSIDHNGRTENRRPARVAQHRRLTLLELAQIFAPRGTVLVIIRHRGRVILHHCSHALAAALPTEGRA